MKESHHVTIKLIADKLGISASTVSRALKDHPDISEATKKAVKDLASQLHYKPNAIALSLLNRQSKIIGVIIPEIVHHFFSLVISGIEEVAYNEGYGVMIFQSNESYEREVLNTKALSVTMVDGLLVSVSKETKNFDHLQDLQDRGFPLVFFDRVCNEIQADKVIVDDMEGAYVATKHLIENGCRKISFFSGPQHLLIVQNRLSGYRKALEEANIEIEENLIFDCDTFEEALVITQKIVQSDNRPDGIFAVNDLTAIGAMLGVKRSGLRVPEDIAIVGFTNSQIANITDPALSSIEQKGFEMGVEAAKLLLRRLDRKNEDFPPVTKILKTKLIARSSSIRTTSNVHV